MEKKNEKQMDRQYSEFHEKSDVDKTRLSPTEVYKGVVKVEARQ